MREVCPIVKLMIKPEVRDVSSHLEIAAIEEEGRGRYFERRAKPYQVASQILDLVFEKSLAGDTITIAKDELREAGAIDDEGHRYPLSEAWAAVTAEKIHYEGIASASRDFAHAYRQPAQDSTSIT